MEVNVEECVDPTLSIYHCRSTTVDLTLSKHGGGHENAFSPEVQMSIGESEKSKKSTFLTFTLHSNKRGCNGPS